MESLVVVTSLLDANKYTRDDIAELYHKRWLVELDLRAIKVNVGMDVLRCKTPEMVRKEIWACLLAYNLIRRTMLQAASAADSERSPRQISFTAAMQKIAACWMISATTDEEGRVELIAVHLGGLAEHRVGHRPDRIEPRAIKRRPKSHKLMTKPRDQARADLLAGLST